MNKKKLLKLLVKRNIEFVCEEFPGADQENAIHCLFVRDEKRHYYLITSDACREYSLNGLRHILGTGPLSFASDNDQRRILRSDRKSLNVFGILNDIFHCSELILDVRMRNRTVNIILHKDNSILRMNSEDLFSLIAKQGHEVRWADLNEIL